MAIFEALIVESQAENRKSFCLLYVVNLKKNGINWSHSLANDVLWLVTVAHLSITSASYHVVPYHVVPSTVHQTPASESNPPMKRIDGEAYSSKKAGKPYSGNIGALKSQQTDPRALLLRAQPPITKL